MKEKARHIPALSAQIRQGICIRPRRATQITTQNLGAASLPYHYKMITPAIYAAISHSPQIKGMSALLTYLAIRATAIPHISRGRGLA